MKLSKFQKVSRKENLVALLAAGGVIANDGFNMTAVFMPTINGNGHFSLSYAGKEKFNRKYGEFVALDRLAYGECLPIDLAMFYDICDLWGLEIRENDPPPSAPAKSQPVAGGGLKTYAWPFPTNQRT